MKSAPLYFVGFALLIFSAAILSLANTVSSSMKDAKYVIAQAPVVVDKVKELKTEVDAIIERADAAAKRIKETLPSAVPAAGSKIGEAGANAIKSFADRISSKEKPGHEPQDPGGQ